MRPSDRKAFVVEVGALELKITATVIDEEVDKTKTSFMAFEVTDT